jgi:Galactose oxidase-like, Early set domain
MLRSDHNTHSLTTGDRYVKLAFHQKGGAHKKGAAHNGEIRVRAPKLPAQAVPGIYMLFVVDKAGVPSMGKQVRLESDTPGHRRALEHAKHEGGIQVHSRTEDR